MAQNVELTASEQRALQRVRSILAGARGVNVRSRVMLEALSRELSIPSERMEQLVRLANSPQSPLAGPAPAETLTAEQRDLLRRGVLTIVRPGDPPFILEQNWRELIAYSVESLALPGEVVEQTLHQERDALGAVLLGPEQAMHHLLAASRRIRKLQGDTPETRRQLVRLAASLEIDSQMLASEAAGAKSPAFKLRTAITGAGVLLVLAASAGVWYWIFGGEGRSNANATPKVAMRNSPRGSYPRNTDADDATPNPPPNPAPDAAPPGASVSAGESLSPRTWWWEDPLTEPVLQRWREQWRRLHPRANESDFPGPSEDESALQFYASLDSLPRFSGAGVEEAGQGGDATSDAWSWSPPPEFLAICLHREPDPVAKARLWKWLEQQLSIDDRPDAGWPSLEHLRAADVLLSAIWQAGIGDDQGPSSWRTRLAGVLQVPVLDSQGAEQQLRAQWWRGVLARVRRLTPQALQPPSGLWLAAVLREAAGRLPAAEIEDEKLALCTALLQREDSAWREHEALIEQVIASPAAPVVARIAEIYAATTDKALQTFLQERLLRRIGSLEEGLGREQTVAAVRQALGLPSGREKVEPSVWEAARELAGRPMGLDETENLQHLLDCALWCVLLEASSHPQAKLLYQQWSREPPRRLPQPMSSPASAVDSLDGRGLPENAAPQDDAPVPEAESSAKLATDVWFDIAYEPWEAMSPIDRMRAIDAVADAILRGERPTRRVAEAIARLMVLDKSGREIQHQRRRYSDLGKSIEMRLAIADVVLNAPLAEADLRELVERLMLRRVGETDAEPVPQLLHRRLLLSIQEMLPEPIVQQQDLGAVYEFAGQSLAEYYRRLAALRRVALESDVVEPGRILMTLAQDAGKRLPKEVRAVWRSELAAAEYVAVNDLQRTALLQRLWLQQRWGGSPEFAGVLEWLREQDREAGDIVRQAACGQTAWLRCLLLERDLAGDALDKRATP